MRSASFVSLIRLRAPLAALALTAICGASAANAQARAEQTLYRTRPFLDSVATALERNGKSTDAAAIRERMKVGDFYPGDRVVVEMFGSEEPLRDTVPVRAGQELLIGQFPAFSLRGVLRSEADSALVAQARRYIQRPVIRTQPLVRLLVTGAVGRPNFVTVRGDAAVSDVVTAAGGLTSASRLNKSKIKRGSGTLVDSDSLGTIFQSGMTLDQADIRAGDEIAISEKKQGGFTGMIWAASAAIGVILSLVSLAR